MISVDLSNVESIESRNHLYQWDKGQQLEIKGLGVSKAPEIHFGVNGSMLAIVVNSTLSGGIVYADIPNEILMSGKDLRVYVHIDGTTIKNILIPVFKRNMPENYVVDSSNVTWIEEFETEANEITTAKLTEIDRKGTQTLDSIPNDYTALQNDVTELKDEVTKARLNASGITYSTLKVRLDAMDAETAGKIGTSAVESTLADSTNPVQSKVVKEAVTDLKSDLSELGKYSIVNLGYATNETTEKDGITFTNNNGKNTLNGTATNNISFRLTQFTVTKDAQIKLSGFDGTHKTCIIWIQDIDTGEYSANCFGGQTIDVNLIAGHSYYLDIYITGGSRFDNYVLDTTIYFYRRTDALEMFPICLTSNNINTYLYDANKALPNTKYRISSRVIPQNMPPKMPNPLNCYTETQTTDAGNIQYIKDFATDKVLWKRFHTGVWESVTHEVTVGLGYGDWDFSTLYEALLFAYSNENTHLTVYDGTYDIIEEMGADLTSESIGILLGKNMVVDFKPHAYVVCNYTGSDVGVKGIFSPFYAGMGNFEINNMKLSCSNVRYCVHDEKSDGADSYSHKYINCSFYIDNRNNTEGFPQCIGGGLGKNGHIEIVGCSFESETINPNGEKAEASYHNSSASGAKSEVIVKDNFFENGTFRISYYGASTEKTYAYVSNNRMKYAPYVSQENTSYNNVNVELRAWNNEIVN